MTQRFVIPKAGGGLRFINSPEAMQFAKQAAGGDVTIRRASHVDPVADLRPAALQWLTDAQQAPANQNDWYADLLPVGGPVLGPFTTHQAAIDAEIAWLQQHNIPIAGPPVESKPS